MILKRYTNRTSQSWQTIFTRYSLWVITVSLLMMLVACGGGNTAAVTGNPATTPTIATSAAAATSTPTPSPTRSSTPTPTTQSTPAPGLAQSIQITNGSNGSFGFSPATLTVKVGTTVTWHNGSLAPHTVTSDDGQTFDSGNVLVGGTFHFTFTTAGTFPYHCNIHPYMRATILVVSA